MPACVCVLIVSRYVDGLVVVLSFKASFQLTLPAAIQYDLHVHSTILLGALIANLSTLPSNRHHAHIYAFFGTGYLIKSIS